MILTCADCGLNGVSCRSQPVYSTLHKIEAQVFGLCHIIRSLWDHLIHAQHGLSSIILFFSFIISLWSSFWYYLIWLNNHMRSKLCTRSSQEDYVSISWLDKKFFFFLCPYSLLVEIDRVWIDWSAQYKGRFSGLVIPGASNLLPFAHKDSSLISFTQSHHWCHNFYLALMGLYPLKTMETVA